MGDTASAEENLLDAQEIAEGIPMQQMETPALAEELREETTAEFEDG